MCIWAKAAVASPCPALAGRHLGWGSAAWLTIRPRDRLFRGKPESYWIEHLPYRDEEQVRQWREFGSDGVRVLVRGVDGARRPMDRLYRNAYRKLWRILPSGLMRLLPKVRWPHRTKPADLVITDLYVPNQEGLETIMELRRRFPEVAIIAMSGKPEAGTMLSIAPKGWERSWK